MAQLDVRREYADGEILLASDLDAFLNDIETFLNIIKLNNDNIQDGGINAASKLANNSVTTAKLANGAITTAKIAEGAVTTDKIAIGAITTTKIADEAVTSAKIADGAVTSAKISDAAKGAIKTFSSTSLSGASTFIVPANVYTIHVEGLGGGKVWNGITYSNAVEITRIFSVTPASSISYTAGSGLKVWY